jgi:TolA-binding protein
LKIKPENRFWIAIYGFTAFIMLVAMSVFGWLAWTSHAESGVGHVAGGRPASAAANAIPDERYEFLAAFSAPEYVPMKGASKPFQAAMSLYQKHDYSGAASALRAIADAQRGLGDARFYLGVSLLLAGDRIGGIQELRALTDAGDSPYLERGRFYLAKGMLAEHDAKRAQEQLENLIEQHGNLEKQATALLEQIRSS